MIVNAKERAAVILRQMDVATKTERAHRRIRLRPDSSMPVVTKTQMLRVGGALEAQ